MSPAGFVAVAFSGSAGSAAPESEGVGAGALRPAAAERRVAVRRDPGLRVRGGGGDREAAGGAAADVDGRAGDARVRQGREGECGSARRARVDLRGRARAGGGRGVAGEVGDRQPVAVAGGREHRGVGIRGRRPAAERAARAACEGRFLALDDLRRGVDAGAAVGAVVERQSHRGRAVPGPRRQRGRLPGGRDPVDRDVVDVAVLDVAHVLHRRHQRAVALGLGGLRPRGRSTAPSRRAPARSSFRSSTRGSHPSSGRTRRDGARCRRRRRRRP